MTRELTLDHVRSGSPTHAVASDAWRRDDLLTVFDEAEWMARQPRQRLATIAPHAIVGLLFYQNSTRTRISFEAAASMLGASPVGFATAKTTRAGDFFQESLEDTVQVVGSYADLMVLRHVDDDAALRAAAVSPVPVINAGTGESDHPTQGMLDAWTMYRQLGGLSSARVGIFGDPGCRAIRAIVTTVSRFGPAEFVFLVPPDAEVPAEMRDQLTDAGIPYTVVDDSAELVRRVDVVSMIPFELPDFHVPAADSHRSDHLPDRYRISRRLLETAGRNVVVLHTGPRGDELPSEVDELPNVHYFDGVRNGMFLRAALMNVLWRTAGVRFTAGS
jgi:aspartate carbamoyltransferase catalytic subunit